jgi:hypothetical protein
MPSASKHHPALAVTTSAVAIALAIAGDDNVISAAAVIANDGAFHYY